MLFNSAEFLFFLPIVFILYWFVFNKSLKGQNILILVSSYVFYGWWDWRFLSLIAFSTLVDFIVGIQIHHSASSRRRRTYLWISLLVNLGMLGFFKYFNFFVESWIEMLHRFGIESTNTWTLYIVLPVGISFYTFQTMSYSLDVYRGQIEPTKDFISFASFVSFFPQLVAGPIERASNLLPQILQHRKFDYQKGTQGVRLIIWGMFKKVFIADSLAPEVNQIFANYQDLNGGVLMLGAIYFGFQIYCDFSGYSDIAIGTAKLFGFDLMSNFKFPYFSRNIGEFWRRWHISLSTWFRDYLYIPLGGSKTSSINSLRNIFIIFVVSGFWHGANWTFIVWGLIHAIMYIPLFIRGTNRRFLSNVAGQNSLFPSIQELTQIIITFSLVTLAWIFFRSPSITMAFDYIKLMFLNIDFPDQFRKATFYLLIIVLLDWFLRKDETLNFKWKPAFSIFINVLFIILIFLKFNKTPTSFIYFQF
ncbi:MAG: MBOAT family protein [Saprospiraceae bacterium]|nr:MBOAT family protein [Saprospiraceae bacterium]